MSLPHASQEQIRAMQKAADEKLRQEGVVIEEPQTPVLEQKHPMLMYQEEPQIQQPESDVEQPEQEMVEQQEPIAQMPQETNKEYNFRMMREKYEREIEVLRNQIQQKPEVIEPEEDVLASVGLHEEDFVEAKHFKKALKEMREIKKELQNYKSKTTQDTVELRLRANYPDIDKVLTADNVERFRQMNPDLADVIAQNPDTEKKAKLVYEMVKQYGIYKDPVLYEADKATALKNASKPKPLTSLSAQQGDSPLSKANAFAQGLTPDLKKQMHKEMIEAMKVR